MKSFFYILFFILLSFKGSAQINFPALSGRNGNLLPTLTTTAATSITSTSASSGGNVTSDGGASVSARGIVWSTSPNPDISSPLGITTNGSGTGVFMSSISGLTFGNTYYVRSYATNTLGTSYGNQVSFMTSILQIGDSYQGGQIAYILVSGDPGYDANVQHGLIAATSNQSTGNYGLIWNNGSFTTTGATGTAIGTGLSNTNSIIAAQGATSTSYAAGLARAYTGGGYTDWYLPSIDELAKLYAMNLLGFGDFNGLDYWSSTELDDFKAGAKFFAGGYQAYWFKNNRMSVRAIRAF